MQTATSIRVRDSLRERCAVISQRLVIYSDRTADSMAHRERKVEVRRNRGKLFNDPPGDPPKLPSRVMESATMMAWEIFWERTMENKTGLDKQVGFARKTQLSCNQISPHA